MTAAAPISRAVVGAAACAIAGAVETTPARHSRTLSAIAGADIFLKFENLQFTASFKERGALNKLLALSAEERIRGVIAMSAGNHAQGVAYHAGRLGIPATIVMPEGTPFTKITHTRDFGARVVIEGASLADADRHARSLAAETGSIFVHPYDDPLVIAGQGTVALEFLEQVPELDAIIVPVGGGGLIAGIAVAARALKPGTAIYGVEATLYPAMYNAVKGTNLPVAGRTVADGIAVETPGAIAQTIVQTMVDDIVLADESAIESAMVTLLEIEKTLVEGAGAAPLAAVLAEPARFKGRKVGLILSGGNVDLRLVSNVILRQLAQKGRILSLALTIDDRPGLLAGVAAIIGDSGGNILEVSHNRLMTGVSAKSAELGLVIEARDAAHAAEIRRRLEGAGYTLRQAG
jgi:threonine dehydratase